MLHTKLRTLLQEILRYLTMTYMYVHVCTCTYMYVCMSHLHTCSLNLALPTHRVGLHFTTFGNRF